MCRFFFKGPIDRVSSSAGTQEFLRSLHAKSLLKQSSLGLGQCLILQTLNFMGFDPVNIGNNKTKIWISGNNGLHPKQ